MHPISWKQIHCRCKYLLLIMIFQPFIGKQGWVVGKTINTNLHVHVLLKVNHGFPRSLKLVLMANFKLKVKKSLSQN